VSAMFSAVDPCFVSGSAAELGPCAGQITWRNALGIAEEREAWLLSPEGAAREGMVEWAHDTGAWGESETSQWTAEDCLALFAQNVASDLRLLGADDTDLTACADRYASSDWDRESECPRGHYYLDGGSLFVDFYTGP